MEYNIGESIKKMRILKGITQERLANHLGVSAQAISKWETNLSMPDIAMLPRLARYFDVSIDEVMGYKKVSDNNEEIDKIIQECRNYMVGMDMEGAETILLKGIEKYTGNHKLLSSLAALYSTWRGLIASRYFQDSEKNDEIVEKGIRICNLLIEESEDGHVIGCALNDMALLYKNDGNFEMSEKTANKMYDIAKFKLLGQIYTQSDNEKALGYMQQALLIALERAADICVNITDILYSMDLKKTRDYIILGISLLKNVESENFMQVNFTLYWCYNTLAVVNCIEVGCTLEGEPDNHEKIERQFNDYLDTLDIAISYLEKYLSDTADYRDDYYFNLLIKEYNETFEASKAWQTLNDMFNNRLSYPGFDTYKKCDKYERISRRIQENLNKYS